MKYIVQVFIDETTCVHSASMDSRAAVEAWIKHVVTKGLWTRNLLDARTPRTCVYPPHRIHHIDMLLQEEGREA